MNKNNPYKLYYLNTLEKFSLIIFVLMGLTILFFNSNSAQWIKDTVFILLMIVHITYLLFVTIIFFIEIRLYLKKRKAETFKFKTSKNVALKKS